MISYKLEAIQNVSKVFASRNKQKNTTEYQKIKQTSNQYENHFGVQYERMDINNQKEFRIDMSDTNKSDKSKCSLYESCGNTL